MRALADLPVVSCRFGLSDNVDDIESFRAGARRADWTEGEITRAVLTSVHESRSFNDIGILLFQYCTELRFTRSMHTARR